MKSSIIAMSVAALLAFGVANAATPAAAPAKPQTAQQTKMGACATANKGKKGDDYKNSVAACMKAPTAAAAAPAPAPRPATTPPTATRSKGAQQQKMSDCAKANKGKKGDDYKNAMSACLKK